MPMGAQQQEDSLHTLHSNSQIMLCPLRRQCPEHSNQQIVLLGIQPRNSANNSSSSMLYSQFPQILYSVTVIRNE